MALTVTGSGFLQGSVVQLNGSPIATTFVSGATLTAVVPQSALVTPGFDSIVVMNPASPVSQMSNALTLTVFTTPVITSLSPNSVSLGAAGFTLTLNGTGFNAQSTVTWNGTALVTALVGPTQLTAVVPAALLNTVGSPSVSVSNGPGIVSNSLPFQVTTLQPSLTSLSPASSIQNAAGFTLTLTGTGFVGPADCNGTNCSPSRAVFGTTSLQTTFVSRTQLTAAIPASLLTAAGAFPVTIVNNAEVSNAVTLTVFKPPVITSLSPNSASLGAAGFTLTVNGTGFIAHSTVIWNGTSLVTTLIGATQLTAVVPAALLTAVDSPSVSVSNGPGIVSNSLPFQVMTLQPSLTSLSPAASIQNAAGLTLTLTGTGFVGAADCSGTNCSPSRAVFGTTSLQTTFVSRTKLTAAVPASLLTTAGAFPVTVVNNALVSNAVSFLVAIPVLSGLSPSSAVAGSSPLTLTVTGTGFLPSSTLTWNGTALTTTFVSATQLTAAVPATLLAEPASVSVAATTLTFTSNALTFTVNQPTPPSLTLSTPSSVGPAQQPTVGFVLNSGYPIPLDGTVTLTFAPNAAVPDDDPAIQFATGGRTLKFSLPANSTALPALNIQTGTVAGTITIAVTLTADGVDVTPPGSTATIAIARAAPVITSVSLVRGASSVQLNVVGYATSREVVQGVFQFTPSANNTFTSPNITVPLSTAFVTWYQSAPGASFGSQFMLSQSFSLGGNSDAVCLRYRNAPERRGYFSGGYREVIALMKCFACSAPAAWATSIRSGT